MISNVLSIAGSDPSGGAGIQADLKTFAALGCHGMSVITALTAQNTQGVRGVHDVPAEFVGDQLEALFEDSAISSVKIGMLGSVETIKVIANVLKTFQPPYVVLDPVMIAQSGDRLISDDAVEALKEFLIPMATIITPNIPEAEVLMQKDYEGDIEGFASALFDQYRVPVLLKGGHDDSQDDSQDDSGAQMIDVLVTEHGPQNYEAVKIETKNNHGTGCTLSSGICSYLAKDAELSEAIAHAKAYITSALKLSDQLQVGKGAGPVHHFHALWDES